MNTTDTTATPAGPDPKKRLLRLPSILKQVRDLRRLPEVTIEMWGDRPCTIAYDYFTKRHPKYRVIQNKRWGAALYRLPDTFADYSGHRFRSLRQHVSRAQRLGYKFEPIDPFIHVDAVMDINRSGGERQGQAMHPDYLDEAAVRHYFNQTTSVYGVFDSTGALRGYADIVVCGELAHMGRLLGHAEALNDGVMFLLVTELIRVLIERRHLDGRPVWFMYDTFPGGSKGLQQFKHRLGFDPYRVNWVWRP